MNSEEDYRSVINQLREELVSLTPTSNSALDFAELSSYSQLFGATREGDLDTLLEELIREFVKNEQEIVVSSDCVTEIGFQDDELAHRFFVIYWRLKCLSAGSLNVPYLFLRRTNTTFALTMPEN